MTRIESWGRIGMLGEARPVWWRDETLDTSGGTLLAHGMGRSYGDCCLNDGGVVLLTRPMSRFIAFDAGTGVLACEAGVTLGDILDRFAPLGFFPPVVPGTRHVTVGGAIANDVHGKNHHRAGTFGAHVLRLELARSDGARLLCTPSENAPLFEATVGGLGLTGLVTWVELRLKRIPGELVECETIPFENVDAFLELSARSDETHEYTVAWIDCLARGARLGRGLLFRGNHAPGSGPTPASRRRVAIPFDLPSFALNRLTVKAFNAMYRFRHRTSTQRRLVHYEPFFFPLDGVERWNRIYGRRGLLQFQCVVPFDRGSAGVRALLDAIARSGRGSFLAVLKVFGARRSPGVLSFPRPGVTLALDFPNAADVRADLFPRLEALVLEHGGAMYPAKDATMSGRMFRASFPALDAFAAQRDPAFSSSFWRRVTREGTP